MLIKRAAFLVLIACSRSELDSDDQANDSFCARFVPRPLFCDDFDTGTLQRWTESSVSNGALAPTSVEFTSSPYALNANIASGGSHAQVLKSFEGSTGFTRMRIAFDIRSDPGCFTESTQIDGIMVMSVDTSPMQGYGDRGFFAQLNLAGTVTSLVYELPARPTGATQGPLTAFASAVPNGVWSHVQIEIDVAKKVLTIVAGDVTTTKSVPAWPAGGTLDNPTITLGVAGGVTPCTTLFDDFIFDAH